MNRKKIEYRMWRKKHRCQCNPKHHRVCKWHRDARRFVRRGAAEIRKQLKQQNHMEV